MTEDHPEFPLLFSPLQIGPMTLKNRIVNAPHQTGYAHAGRYTDQLVDYHRERARGGAAFIVSQATSVVPGYLDLYNDSDEIIPQYAAVQKAVSEHGAHYGAELNHPGSQGSYHGPDASVFVSPSGVPAEYFHAGWRVPHALTDDEILALVDAFGAAAARCRAGGLSAVELHFAHGNLVEQFISPRTNRRKDDWGGSLENRLRFAELILTAVRAAVGPDIAVGARMTALGLDPGEPSAMDMTEIIGTVGSWDLLDYVSLTVGHYSDALNTARNVPNMTFAPGLWQRYGRAIKSVLEVPTFLVGRINHPRTAEDMLEAGACDGVSMVRALIADPFLPEKARSGRTEQIRPCVGAMNCLQHLDHGEGIRCIHNPAVSREGWMSEDVGMTQRPQKIVVVGGGPAGLEHARVSALRGHDVVLLEKAAKVGGQVLTSSLAPTRSELFNITEWLHQQCLVAGVTIRTEVEATAEIVAALAPDTVAIATGSRLPDNPFDGGPLPSLDPWRGLTKEPMTGRIALYDALGDWQGISVAHAFCDRGAEVVYVSPTPYPGSALELTNWRLEYEQLVAAGVEFHPITDVVETAERALVVRTGYARTTAHIGDLDALVWIGAPVAQDALFHELRSTDIDVVLIGDAYSPRGIEDSIFEGRDAALRV
ncbi:oxidoreductase [Aeromicrobium sp. P5_D10]